MLAIFFLFNYDRKLLVLLSKNVIISTHKISVGESLLQTFVSNMRNLPFLFVGVTENLLKALSILCGVKCIVSSDC